MKRTLSLCFVLVIGACAGDPCPLDGPEDCNTICLADPAVRDGTVRYCADECTSNADCAGGQTCGTLFGGTRACLAMCTSGSGSIRSSVCIEGAQVACSEADPSLVSCRDCCSTGSDCVLCGDAEVCGQDGECRPPGALGEPCASEGECESANCSVLDPYGETGVCHVAHGAECTGDNCSLCVSTEGTTYCHVRCTGGGGAGCDRCLGNAEEDVFWCYDDAEGSIGSQTCPSGYSGMIIRPDLVQASCVPRTEAIICGTASLGPLCP